MVTKGARHERETALCYVLTGDRRYADAVRRLLLDYAREFQANVKKIDLKVHPEFDSWSRAASMPGPTT